MGVMSLKMMPFFGKSGTSRTPNRSFSRMSEFTKAMLAEARLRSTGLPIEMAALEWNMEFPVDRYFLIASTVCFLVAIVHTIAQIRGGIFRPMRFNFFAVGL